VAELTGGLSVFETVYPNAGTMIVRRYYDKFSRFMSAEEKRTFLACRLAASESLVAAIGSDGTARDSVRGTLAEDAVSVACGTSHVLVLLSDGTVRAFGANGAGQCGANGLTSAVAVAAAGDHSLVLLSNGTVRAFGSNSAGQCAVTGWRNVIAVAAGKEHSVALCADGTVLACGSNGSGQCSVSQYKNVVSVAAGEYATALVFRDGSVLAEGNLTVETLETREWDDVVRVSVGNAHLIALTSGGRVLSAGLSVCGSEIKTSGWSRIRAVACGGRVSYALDATGQLLFCGEDAPELSSEGWGPLG
jgi:alpha-tubulin suppressor-like RCC1 family protein